MYCEIQEIILKNNLIEKKKLHLKASMGNNSNSREESRVASVGVVEVGGYFTMFYKKTGNSNKLYNAYIWQIF